MINKILDIFCIEGMKRREAIEFAVVFEQATRYDRAMIMGKILDGYCDEDYTMADLKRFIDKIVELNPEKDRTKLRTWLHRAIGKDLFALGHNKKLFDKTKDGFQKRMEDLLWAAGFGETDNENYRYQFN